MNAHRSLRRGTFMLVLLSLLAYGVASGGPGAALLAIGLACAGWLLTEGKTPWAPPRWVIAIVLILVIFRGLAALSGNAGSSVGPFLTFLASIVVIKCWERRQPRDHAQLISICVFVLIGSALGNNGFSTAVVILLAMPFVIQSVVLLQIVAAAARANSNPEAIDAIRLPGMHRFNAGLLLAAAGLGAIVFVIVPRTHGASSLAGLGLGASRMSAFRDRIDLGQGGLISDSQAVVLDVEIKGESGVPSVAGPGGELYLRGAVLERYWAEDGTWVRREWFNNDRDVRRYDASSDDPAPMSIDADTRGKLDIVVRDREGLGRPRPIFTPWRALSVRPEDGKAASVNVDLATASGVFEPSTPVAYRVTCSPDLHTSLDDAPAVRTRVEDIQSNRVHDMAMGILREAGLNPDPLVRPITDDFRAARTLEAYLRSRFRYTRELLAAPRGEDPVEWFLTSSREGHCEYFASALASLCRSVGINARVITGYVTSEFDARRNSYVVRQANAHAWVEAEVGPDRWRMFDATPSEELARLSGSGSGVLVWLERWLAGVESSWNTRIVKFGQSDGATSFLEGTLGSWISETSSRIESLVKRRGWLPIFTWGLVILGAASLAFAGVVSIARGLRHRFRGGSKLGSAVHGPAASLYARLLKAMEKLGTPKPAWRGAIEHAGAFQGRPEADAVLSAARRCSEVFFSGRDLSPEVLALVRADVEKVEGLVRQRRRGA